MAREVAEEPTVRSRFSLSRPTRSVLLGWAGLLFAAGWILEAGLGRPELGQIAFLGCLACAGWTFLADVVRNPRCW